MRVKVNGRIEEFIEESLSITEILEKMKYTSPGIIVKYSGKIIREEDFNEVYLRDSDEILVIHIFAGG